MKTSWTDFLNTMAGAAKDSTYKAVNDITQSFTTTAKAAEAFAGIKETQYPHDENRFPDDLGSDQTGHYIRLKAYTGGYQSSGGFSPPNNNAYTAYLFIPGAAPGEQMPLIYDQNHNFTDIRLTNIVNDSLLGVTVALATRKSINPMVQVLYRSSNLRQFDFSFLMVPRNENESKAIENIVKNIRAYSSPEFVGPAVIAPAEFEIAFMNKGQENPHLPKIERCVITKVQANFAPPGTFSTFRNGYPVSCLLTFSATEVRLIDRTKIMQQGY
jgi:hypothetical protein